MNTYRSNPQPTYNINPTHIYHNIIIYQKRARQQELRRQRIESQKIITAERRERNREYNRKRTEEYLMRKEED